MVKAQGQKTVKNTPLSFLIEELSSELTPKQKMLWTVHEKKALRWLRYSLIPVANHFLFYQKNWPYDQKLGEPLKEIQRVYRTKKNGPLSITVKLLTDGQMKELNGQWRQKWKTTDVLSFPQFELSKKVGFEEWRLQVEENCPISLGDIAISFPMMRSQAITFGWTPLEEFSRLLVHGFLHLVGLDHERSKKEDQWMRQQEAYILEQCGLGDLFYF